MSKEKLVRTARVKVYKFEGLSKEAQQKAIESMRDINVDYEWWDFTYDGFKEDAKEAGFDVDKIYFSGFASQGDGAMFEGEVNDITNFISNLNPHVQRVIKAGRMNISWSVVHRGHYYHSHCTEISFDAGDYPGYFVSGKGWQGNFQDNMDKLEETISDAYHDLCHKLYRTLEKEYDYLTSNEAIKDTIIANEYEFTKDGKQFTAK